MDAILRQYLFISKLFSFFFTLSLLCRDVSCFLNLMSLLNDPVSPNLPWGQLPLLCLVPSIHSLYPLVRICAAVLRWATQAPFQDWRTYFPDAGSAGARWPSAISLLQALTQQNEVTTLTVTPPSLGSSPLITGSRGGYQDPAFSLWIETCWRVFPASEFLMCQLRSSVKLHLTQLLPQSNPVYFPCLLQVLNLRASLQTSLHLRVCIPGSLLCDIKSVSNGHLQIW